MSCSSCKNPLKGWGSRRLRGLHAFSLKACCEAAAVLAAEVPLGVDLANIRNLKAARRRTLYLCHPTPVSFLQTQSREGV